MRPNPATRQLRRPYFRAVAIGYGSAEQDADQPFLLPAGESSRAARRKSHLEGIGAVSSPRIPPPHHGTGRAPDASSHFVQGQFRAKKLQRTPAPVGQQVGRTLGSHRDLQSCGDPIIALFYVRAISEGIAYFFAGHLQPEFNPAKSLPALYANHLQRLVCLVLSVLLFFADLGATSEGQDELPQSF